MSRANVRDKWIRIVLASDLTPVTKTVMTALYLHMDAEGRVKRRRDELANDCGQGNPRRVSDRIKEARDAGFLTARSGGVNGQVVQYYAELPGSLSQGPSTQHRGSSKQGPTNRDPQTPPEHRPGSLSQGPIRARAFLETTHGTPPAPDGSRVSGLHLVQTQDGSNEGVSTYSPPVASHVLDAPTTTSDKPTARAGRTRVLPATRPTTARVHARVTEHRPGNDVPPVHDYPSPPGRGATRDDFEAYGRALRLLVLDNTKVDAA